MLPFFPRSLSLSLSLSFSLPLSLPLSGQQYCSSNPSEKLCNDGGTTWAIAPIGTAAK